MAEYDITCISLDTADEERRVRGVGGSCWCFPAETAIEMIKKGERFCVSVLGYRVDVVVEKHARSGVEYLTTLGAGFPPNNLLRLPHCRG